MYASCRVGLVTALVVSTFVLVGVAGRPAVVAIDVDEPAVTATEISRDDSLKSLAFIVGTWRGEYDGEFVEEIWSAPRGGAMMGMFRWLNTDEQSRMYELLTMSREGEQTFLRLRHFNRAMHAWEERDAPVELTLAEQGEGVAVFENVDADDRMERIEFRRIDGTGLGIDVIFREDRNMPPLRFRFERAASE